MTLNMRYVSKGERQTGHLSICAKQSAQTQRWRHGRSVYERRAGGQVVRWWGRLGLLRGLPRDFTLSKLAANQIL